MTSHRFLSLFVLLFCTVAQATQIPGTATVWGRHLFPYIPPSTTFSNVAAAGNLTYAISSTGQLFFWGEGWDAPSKQLDAGVKVVDAGGNEWGNAAIALLDDGRVMSLLTWSTPNNLTNITAISSSRSHYLALRKDGTVFDSSGTSMPDGLSGVAKIAAGEEFSLAVLSNGTVQVWGRFYYDLPDNLINVVDAVAGQDQAMLLLDDGTVLMLGEGEGTEPETLSNVVSIASGDEHWMALKSDGTVVSWGWDPWDEIITPDGLQDVVKIAAGANHCVALKANGSITSWGRNDFGQCLAPEDFRNVVSTANGWGFSMLVKANGTIVPVGEFGNSEVQAWVPNGLSNVLKVAAGEHHVLALKGDGTVIAWGGNSSGQCNVPIGLSGVKAIAAGDSLSVALKQDGTVVTWGYLPSDTPKPANLTNVIAIAAGSAHILALRKDGTVATWGSNWYDETDVPEDFSDVIAIAAKHSMSLILTATGEVVSWGYPEPDQPNESGIVKMQYGLYVKSTGQISNWGWDASEVFYDYPTNLFWISDIGIGYDLRSLIVSEPRAPYFVREPQNTMFVRGQPVTLSCVADGPHPIHFQWQKNGTNIPGATNRLYTISKLHASDGGEYRVIAWNAYGDATSLTASLAVTIPLPLEQALGSSLIWRTGGDVDWFSQSAVSLDGLAAASGNLKANQETWIETVVSGPGWLTFSWRHETSAYMSDLSLTRNGVGSLGYSGVSIWNTEQEYLGSGQHTMRWTLSSMGEVLNGANAAWIDQVYFTPEYPAENYQMSTLLTTNGISFQVQTLDENERVYVLQVSSNLVDWLSFTNISLSESLSIPTETQGLQLFYRAITP